MRSAGVWHARRPGVRLLADAGADLLVLPVLREHHVRRVRHGEAVAADAVWAGACGVGR